jgi:hypothetical protein
MVWVEVDGGVKIRLSELSWVRVEPPERVFQVARIITVPLILDGVATSPAPRQPSSPDWKLTISLNGVNTP